MSSLQLGEEKVNLDQILDFPASCWGGSSCAQGWIFQSQFDSPKVTIGRELEKIWIHIDNSRLYFVVTKQLHNIVWCGDGDRPVMSANISQSIENLGKWGWVMRHDNVASFREGTLENTGWLVVAGVTEHHNDENFLR